MASDTKPPASAQYGVPDRTGPRDSTGPETTTDCAEFWPSPIAWARDHEATVPADSIDLWPTPLGWSADLREATK